MHLGASRRILLAEPVRFPPSNRPATLLALEDNQSSANALESTRTTIHTNYRRGARLARRCVEVFPPLFRRTKPLTLPDAAPYSDADEEEAFRALAINSSTRLALTLLAAFLLDWRRISAASSAGRKPFSATQSTYGSFRISSCATRDAIGCNQGHSDLRSQCHSEALRGTRKQSAHLLFSRRGAIRGNHG